MKCVCTVFGTWAVNGNCHRYHHHHQQRNLIAEVGEVSNYLKKHLSKFLSYRTSSNRQCNCVKQTGQSETSILWQQWLVQGVGVYLKGPMRVLSWDWRRFAGRESLGEGVWNGAAFPAVQALERNPLTFSPKQRPSVISSKGLWYLFYFH